jgi:hypothetical protein
MMSSLWSSCLFARSFMGGVYDALGAWDCFGLEGLDVDWLDLCRKRSPMLPTDVKECDLSPRSTHPDRDSSSGRANQASDHEETETHPMPSHTGSEHSRLLEP